MLSVKRMEIVEEARSWIGTPWRQQGRTRRGVDCGGLISVVFTKFNPELVDAKNYHKSPKGQSFVELFRTQFDTINPKDLSLGDIVLFRDNTYPCHCAIIGEKYGQRSLIHSYASQRGVVENVWTDDWAKLITHAFRYPMLVD